MGDLRYHPAEAAWILSRSEWLEARAAFYRATGFARNDGMLPLPVTPGQIVARKITSIANTRSWVNAPEYRFDAPADDMGIALSSLVWTPEPPGALEPAPPPRYDTRTLVRLPDPPRRIVPDPTRCVVVLDEPNLAVLPAPRVILKGEPVPSVRLYPAEVSALLVGVLAVRASEVGQPHGRFLVRADGGQIAPDLSWLRTRWGTELSVVFLPPVVMTDDAISAAVPLYLEAEDAVLVQRPHRYIPASAVDRISLEPGVVQAPPDTQILKAPQSALTRVRSLVVETGYGTNNNAQRIDAGWIGSRVRSSPTVAQRISREIGRIDNNVARIAAAVTDTVAGTVKAALKGDVSLDQIGAAVLVTALSGPAGLTLLSSKDPWRDAARIGSLHYALAYSPLVKLGERAAAQGMAVERAAGGPVAMAPGGNVKLGFNDLSQPRYAVPGLGSPISAADIESAEVVTREMLMLDREGAQAFLVRVVEQGGYIDLIFARLVIEAEACDEKRNALLAKTVARQAEWWDKYGQHIAKGVGLVLDVVAPALGSLLWSLARMLYQAAIVVQQLEVQKRAQREAEARDRDELARLEAEIAALEAQLLATGDALLPVVAGEAPTAPAGSTTPGAAPAVREPWYAPWLRLARREWTE